MEFPKETLDRFVRALWESGRYDVAAAQCGSPESSFRRSERRLPEFKGRIDSVYDVLRRRVEAPWTRSVRRAVAARIKRWGMWPPSSFATMLPPAAAGIVGWTKADAEAALAAAEAAREQAEPPLSGPHSLPEGEPPMPQDGPMWQPIEGPQRQAFESEADILFYGGAAGGGKSDLLIGLALMKHKRSIVFRREYPQLKALEDRAVELSRLYGIYNSGRYVLRFKAKVADRGFDRRLEFGAVASREDLAKYQGRAHDLKAFDEITHFTEEQFKFLIGWNRSADPQQRVRVVCAGNPPMGTDGQWVTKFWAAWLDPDHPNPAKPGELRWYAMIDGEERAVASGDPIVHGRDTIRPVSRSFLPARVEDNPFLMASGYKARLQSLPEPLRSQMLLGDFTTARVDDWNQLIPTQWVKRAMDRWHITPPAQFEVLTHIGVDVARGGRDRTVITCRHGLWFDRQQVAKGHDTPSGRDVVQRILHITTQGRGGFNNGKSTVSHPAIQVDVIGVGGAVHDLLQMRGLISIPLSSAGASTARDRTGQLGFLNKRAEWWWRLREALDPDLGHTLYLPPDQELLADLTAPRWELSGHGIKVESKDQIRERLGRSPDKGDSLVYAWAEMGDANWIYIRKEIQRRRDEEAAKPLKQDSSVVVRVTEGQPPFAFNRDGTRRPDVAPLDPRTVQPGPWYRWTKYGRREWLDPYGKYK